jgi:uncharacterized protein
MSTTLLILAAVLATSVLSGVLGMAGGIILMAILVAVLSVSAAMVVHGIVQGTANGSRAFFLRQHIVWRVMPPYVGGAAIALASFIAVGVLPEPSWVLIVIGTFPFVARLTPKLRGLDMTRPTTAAFCGVIVTGAQLFAGASGPLLDVFYLNAPLNRHQIVASKALTQTLGHVLKLVYYGGIIGLDEPLSPYFLVAAVAVAVLGTRLGTRMIDRFDDTGFRRTSGYVIMGIGAYCIAQGAWGVVNAG